MREQKKHLFLFSFLLLIDVFISFIVHYSVLLKLLKCE